MTRLIYLPDDATVIQLDVKISARQLSAALNAGLQPIPQVFNKGEKLSASQVGNTVVVYPRRKKGRPVKKRTNASLTRRQRQVLELATQGYSNIQIAEIIGISRRTVSYHLKGIKSQIQPGVDSPIPGEPAE